MAQSRASVGGASVKGASVKGALVKGASVGGALAGGALVEATRRVLRRLDNLFRKTHVAIHANEKEQVEAVFKAFNDRVRRVAQLPGKSVTYPRAFFTNLEYEELDDFDEVQTPTQTDWTNWSIGSLQAQRLTLRSGNPLNASNVIRLSTDDTNARFFKITFTQQGFVAEELTDTLSIIHAQVILELLKVYAQLNAILKNINAHNETFFTPTMNGEFMKTHIALLDVTRRNIHEQMEDMPVWVQRYVQALHSIATKLQPS